MVNPIRHYIDIIEKIAAGHAVVNEDETLRYAAQFVPTRGMTQSHVDQVGAWIEQNKLGKLIPDKAPRKVLFVPAVDPKNFYELESKVKELFDVLENKYGFNPFYPDKWAIKPVSA